MNRLIEKSPFFSNFAVMQEHLEFDELFRTYNAELCSFASNVTGDPDAAKDIVQEVFLNLWKNREHIVFGDRIKHYLFKATSSTSLNHLRSMRRLDRLDDRNADFQISAGTDDLSYTEFELHVRKAIDRLPPKCKVIYLLCRHEGLKYKEIADTLDLSVKTVENQMGIALKKLRQDLKPFLTLDILAYLLAAGFSFYFWFCI